MSSIRFLSSLESYLVLTHKVISDQLCIPCRLMRCAWLCYLVRLGWVPRYLYLMVQCRRLRWIQFWVPQCTFKHEFLSKGCSGEMCQYSSIFASFCMWAPSCLLNLMMCQNKGDFSTLISYWDPYKCSNTPQERHWNIPTTCNLQHPKCHILIVLRPWLLILDIMGSNPCLWRGTCGPQNQNSKCRCSIRI